LPCIGPAIQAKQEKIFRHRANRQGL